MQNYTNNQIAKSWNLWREYYDPSATMTAEEFDALTVSERESMLVEAFGQDQADEEESEIPAGEGETEDF